MWSCIYFSCGCKNRRVIYYLLFINLSLFLSIEYSPFLLSQRRLHARSWISRGLPIFLDSPRALLKLFRLYIYVLWHRYYFWIVWQRRDDSTTSGKGQALRMVWWRRIRCNCTSTLVCFPTGWIEIMFVFSGISMISSSPLVTSEYFLRSHSAPQREFKIVFAFGTFACFIP